MATGDRIDRLMALWAKSRSSDPAQQGYHPLPYHLIDVAVVAEAMWEHALTPQVRAAVACKLALSEDEAERWVAFLAGSHDLGKASPLFQLQEKRAIERLQRSGFPATAVGGKAPHGTVTSHDLEPLLENMGVPQPSAALLATAVGGHHGVLPSRAAVEDMQIDAVGRRPWTDARAELAASLAETLHLPEATPCVDDVAALWLAGFISVVDWIGSNQQYFPFGAADHATAPPYDRAYPARSRCRADQALAELGWRAQPPAEQRDFSFEDLFDFAPNAVQRAVMGLQARLDEPGLIIVEAPMGLGKTEAGLWLADRWSATLGYRGFYVALPTQATSDQMFDRVTSYLARRYPADTLNVQLLHGHASLSAAFQELQREGFRLFEPSGVAGEDNRAGVAAAEWFTYRKRGLLAPFGVGTVDQVLLASLQTMHVFVRLFGLSYKTVVVDEVHAYDTYMSTLLQRLLRWLGALDASVVLLSATLPNERRKQLAQAYAQGASGGTQTIPDAPYPRITAVGPSHAPEAVTIPAEGQPRELCLSATPSLLERDGGELTLGRRLRDKLPNGGTAAIICNTVNRAQQVYQALLPYYPGMADDGEPELDLLHARFLWEQRADRERRTLRRFGKPEARTQRPHRAILVSTQIIEQSLDLDFDLMVTELAPIDLVLQRAGRLGRHDRPGRPLSGRDLWIVESEGDAPQLDPSWEAIYFPHLLLQTWLVLRSRKSITIPDDVSELVEAVYGRGSPEDLPPEAQERWQGTLAAMDKDLAGEEQQARLRYIKAPGMVEHLSEIAVAFQREEAPELHPALQALTRLTRPTLTLIVLEERDGRPVLEGRPYNPAQRPDTVAKAALLRRSVNVSNPHLVWTLGAAEAPSGWAKDPLLSHCRLVTLHDGGCPVGKCTLHLDPELGLLLEGPEEE